MTTIWYRENEKAREDARKFVKQSGEYQAIFIEELMDQYHRMSIEQRNKLFVIFYMSALWGDETAKMLQELADYFREA